jgi:hypothetical protein
LAIVSILVVAEALELIELGIRLNVGVGGRQQGGSDEQSRELHSIGAGWIDWTKVIDVGV